MKQPGLLSYFFKLGAEHIHSPVGVKVTGQRDVKPVALFALNDKSVGFAGRALSRLRDYVDHQIPSARLSHFSQRAQLLRSVPLSSRYSHQLSLVERHLRGLTRGATWFRQRSVAP